MESLICKYCKTQFFRHKSRHAKYCSPQCATNDKKRNIVIDFNKNTPELCYWCGFLFGDGCITEKNELKVCLSTKDHKHLECLSMFLLNKNYVNIYNNRCMFGVTSREFCESVKRFGIIPHKTHKSILILPDKNKKDFIRGYFDADGWFSYTQQQNIYNYKYYDRYCWGLCSYLPENLEIINNELPHKGTISCKKNQQLYELRFQSKPKIQDIQDFLYGLPNLKRKWFKVQ